REPADPRPSLSPPRDNSVLSTQYSVLPTMPSPRQELAERTVAPWERPEDRGSPEPIAPPARQNPEPATPEPAPLPVAANTPDATPRPHDPATSPPHDPTPSPQPFPLPPPGSAIQVHDAYLVLETKDGMLVIDQHALHERILFEQLQSRIREGKFEVQRLLIPEPIDLPAEQAALVLEPADPLRELG